MLNLLDDCLKLSFKDTAAVAFEGRSAGGGRAFGDGSKLGAGAAGLALTGVGADFGAGVNSLARASSGLLVPMPFSKVT